MASLSPLFLQKVQNVKCLFAVAWANRAFTEILALTWLCEGWPPGWATSIVGASDGKICLAPNAAAEDLPPGHLKSTLLLLAGD